MAQVVNVDIAQAVRRLKRRRLLLELSLADVGKSLGVHRNSVWRWEQGEHRPRLEQFVQWKRYLDEYERAGGARVRPRPAKMMAAKEDA